MVKTEHQIPIRYGVSWKNSSAPIPDRKAAETDLLNAVISLAEAFGGTNVEVKDVQDAPDKTGKVVTIASDGNLDLQGLESSLRAAVDKAREEEK